MERLSSQDVCSEQDSNGRQRHQFGESVLGIDGRKVTPTVHSIGYYAGSQADGARSSLETGRA